MSNTLVAYFSHAGENYVSGDIVNLPRGNAEVLADFAVAATGADSFRIQRAEAYPAGYNDTVAVAREEKAANARPALAADKDVAEYENVVLIYPNWCGTMPMAVCTWLEGHSFAGKNIYPLCTHEGSGLSATESEIAAACPGANVQKGLGVLGSKAAQSEQTVRDWLHAL